MPNTFNTIPEALAAIQNGEMIIVVDEPDRENEGDLIMAAGKGDTGADQFHGEIRSRLDMLTDLFRTP